MNRKRSIDDKPNGFLNCQNTTSRCAIDQANLTKLPIFFHTVLHTLTKARTTTKIPWCYWHTCFKMMTICTIEDSHFKTKTTFCKILDNTAPKLTILLQNHCETVTRILQTRTALSPTKDSSTSHGIAHCVNASSMPTPPLQAIQVDSVLRT